MSRTLERAYSLIARGAELIGMDDIAQWKVTNATTPDQVPVTDGQGGFVFKDASNLTGVTIPPPPTGTNNALTVDPAGVIRWGGQLSAGEF